MGPDRMAAKRDGEMHRMRKKNPAETVEFYSPQLGFSVEPYITADDKQGIHHVARYQWASMVIADVKPRRVVDVACGAGYGSHMLATASPTCEVIGVDYDPRAVAHAKAHFQQPNLSFREGSMVTWTGAGESLGECDLIISFDTIEHLLHREIALQSIAENLTDDGALILSTPCGFSETRLNPDWEHHKIEFSHIDLFKFLSRFFGRVIQPQDEDFPHYAFWRDVVNKDKARYLNRMNPVICRDPIRSPPYQRKI